MAIAEQAKDDDPSTGPVAADAPAGDFARDTQVAADPAVPGRFHGAIPDAWRVIYAFGGVSMAVAVRAAQAAVDRDDLALLSANATFCSPVQCAPVDIDTAILRNGRSAAQATADLRNSGDEGVALHVAATFGHLHDTDIDFVDATFPDVPPPEECPVPPERSDDDPFPVVNFHQQTDFRPASVVDPWDPDTWEPGHPADFSSWNRLLVEPRLADGTLDPVALCVPGDMLGPAVGMKRGPAGPGTDTKPFFVLTLEIGLQVLRPWETSWILQRTRAPWAADGYGLSVLELWDEQRRLVAHATQRARLRTFDPDEGFFAKGG